MGPSSVWFTKQLPKEKWCELIRNIPENITICLIGSANDVNYCEEIIGLSSRENIVNFSGKLRLLESAALMNGALMNYCNDSGPMHMSSAVNAPTTAFFCSTLPEFGFGPLSDKSIVCQINEKLSCRPCGLHGKSECPEEHFKCGTQIKIPAYPS
jgi:heptosyltransferase-2